MRREADPAGRPDRRRPRSSPRGSAATAATTSPDYTYEPSKEALLTRLVPLYVQIQIYRATLESIAAFFGAQMMAMESATKNAGEMIYRYTLQYNRARQAAITKELLEIIGGAEALKGNEPWLRRFLSELDGPRGPGHRPRRRRCVRLGRAAGDQHGAAPHQQVDRQRAATTSPSRSLSTSASTWFAASRWTRPTVSSAASP